MSVSDTSIEAYIEHKESGKIGKQASYILNSLQDGKSYSRRELANKFNLELSSVCGRVNELLAEGLLEETEKRSCEMTGKTIHPIKIKK